MANLTLAIEDELLIEARKLAVERRTSVNQLVRQYLSQLVREQHHRRAARKGLKAAFERGLVEVGSRDWSREDLYER